MLKRLIHQCMLFRLLTVAGWLLAGFALSGADSVWPHDNSDLPADPRITWGVLENGVRYAVRPHNEPPKRVSLRLLVEVGSLMEEEDERGLAHFVEHMAFNGTKHFEAGEMVKYFQRLGMAFGADTNAHTSFTDTGYHVNLPENDAEMLDKGLLLLRDYASEMTLAAEQIDQERGVILSEMRSRNTVEYRTFKARLNFILPESRLSRRHPIGREEVIRNAPRERFVEFYEKWYVPPRIMVVAVGDVDPRNMGELIKKHFAGLPSVEAGPGDPDLGKVTAAGVEAEMHREADAPAVTVTIHTLHPYSGGPDDREYRLMQLRRAAAHRIIARRLGILAKQSDAPFAEGTSYAYDWLNFVTIGAVELKTDAEQWQAALGVAEAELRRALTHGFTTSEIDQETAELRAHFRQAAKTAATRQSRTIAEEIVRSVTRDHVYTTPETDLEIAREALEYLTPEAALAALKQTWNNSDSRYLFVSGNVDVKGGKTAIRQAYQKSRDRDVEPLAEQEVHTFAYTDFGGQGSIARRKTVDDLGITQVQFKNRVYAQIKPTEFEANTVRVAFRFGAGKLSVPQSKPGLAVLANHAFVQGGLAEHSFTDIQRLFADKTVDVEFTVDDDAFVLSGETSADDVGDQLALMTAFLVDPGYRDDGLRLARKQLDNLYRQMKHTPFGVFQDRVVRFVAGGDSRFGYPPRETVMELTMDDLRTWMQDALQNGMLEVSLVGDTDVDTVLNELHKTVGALPERRAEKSVHAQARKVQFPRAAQRQVIEYETDVPKALVALFWPTTDMWDIQTTRRLNILSRILSDRIRVQVREDSGETYSPQVVSHQSDTFTDYGYLAALLITAPEQADGVTELVRKIGADLSETGATADEVTRARQPLLAGLEEQLRQNRYWLRTVLMSATEHPERLEWARTLQQGYADISRNDVNKTAETYLDSDAAVEVLVRPKP